MGISILLLLIIVAIWVALCAFAVSLCVLAARADRATAATLPIAPDRHTLRSRRASRMPAVRSNVTRLHR